MYILASASPRRKELLGLILNDFKISPSDIEENTPAGLDVDKQPEYLARIKASGIAEKYPDDIVIGADTSVIVGDKILGKPSDKKSAFQMLKLLSNNKHKVITGCAVCKNGECHSFSAETEVEFYPLTDKEIEDYIATGEPFDKAGGYGIQGKGAVLVKGISGDYFNVVGLPVAELHRFLNNV